MSDLGVPLVYKGNPEDLESLENPRNAELVPAVPEDLAFQVSNQEVLRELRELKEGVSQLEHLAGL
jgi:hypothetical protein